MTPDRQRILGRLEGALAGTGLELEDLSDLIASDGATDTGEPVRDDAGETVAELVDIAEQALEPGAVRTYSTYWQILRDGIRLPETWDDERIAQWCADAAAVNDDKDLGLPVPAGPDDLERDDDRAIVVRGFGNRDPSQVRTSQVRILKKWVRVNALAEAARRDRKRAAEGRPPCHWDGKGAEENFIAAIRSLYTLAQGDNVVDDDVSPAAKIRKPKRTTGVHRRAMTKRELEDVWVTSSTTGNDPELDAMLYLFHEQTAARMEGALNLRVRDLLRDTVIKRKRYRQAVRLHQKGDKPTIVPVSAALLGDLEAFATSRGATEPDDHVFRYSTRHPKTGEEHPPLTRRRYNYWYRRVREQHDWAREVEWSGYWLRHHTAMVIEQFGGRPVKQAFLGHEPNGQTDMYGQATFEHVAWAVDQMTRPDEDDPASTRLAWSPHPQAIRPPAVWTSAPTDAQNDDEEADR